mgnify:CR=1 FL=1
MTRRMMKHRTFAYLLMAAASLCLVSACSSGSDAEPTQTTASLPELPIQFAASSVNGVTRAGAADTYDTSLPEGSDIGVYIYDSDGIDISTKQPVDPSDSKTWVYEVTGSPDASDYAALRLTSHVKSPRFPLKNSSDYKDHVKVFAVFPNNPDFMPSGNTGGDSYNFSVAIDQTDADNVKASDLMAADIAQYTSTQCESRLNILLKHRMAKVTVVFQPKVGSDLTEDNMPTNFDVLKVYRTLTVTPTTGAISEGTADQTTEANPLTACTTTSFFLPPQTLSKDNTLLKFNILATDNFKGINGCTFTPADDVPLQAGHQYLITVTVDVDFVTTTGTIEQWNPETMTFDPIVL